MPDTLEADIPVPRVLRRFDTADLSLHGKWVLPRMMTAFPHLNERSVASFLQTVNSNNEYLFLFQDDSVALAQVLSAQTLDASRVVIERFVWAKDRDDKEQVKAAAEFYVEFRRWAKGLNSEIVIVGENTDVPNDLIKEKLGRIYTRQQSFARI